MALHFPLSGLLTALLLTVGCAPQAAPPATVGALRIVVSGDTAGWIVPCGCTSNQSGGLPRRATLVEQLRRDAAVVYVDVGGAVSGNTPYDRLKFAAILEGESQMQVVAHNLGPAELRLGHETLVEMAATQKIPWLASNVRFDQGGNPSSRILFVERAGRLLAFVGVVSPKIAVPGVRIEPPRQAILDIIRSTDRRYDSLIVLAYLDEQELLALAEELPEADVIVGGPTGQSISPKQVGQTLAASATNKGKFVVRLDAPAEQTGRWTGEVLELTDKYVNDPGQDANLQAYYRRLNERDLTPADTPFAPQRTESTPESYRIAGTERCRDCHADECQSWKDTGHARAWESLTRTGAQVDPYCQHCHANGYGVAGGFVTQRRTPQAIGVGCESCHGPSQSHVDNSVTRTAFAAQSAGQCVRCHDRENSPSFTFDAYWSRIQHGKKP